MEDAPLVDTADILLHSLARNEDMNEAAKLSGFIAKSMERKTPLSNGGIRQAAFYVLRGTYAPSALIEMGYVTSSSDLRYLESKKGQEAVAQAIYEGVVNYGKSKGW
ncbi:MAG: N-acetylmuramoyl-L-alanine amidase, partial [Elusimicrobia bacterium]|nr:N-acetylmuramoyl-L-alanine amidase [Elusimicrobiota bacterium]